MEKTKLFQAPTEHEGLLVSFQKGEDTGYSHFI